MGTNQQAIALNTFSQRDNMVSIHELIDKIIKLNGKKNNIEVAIASEKSKKTITITENIEKNIFRLGQFFKQKRRYQKQKSINTESDQYEPLLEIEHLRKLGLDINCSNDANRQKTYTIVFYE